MSVWSTGRGEGREGIRTSAGVSKDIFVEQDGEQRRRDVRQGSNCGIGSSTSGETPDGEYHEPGTDVTGSVGSNWRSESMSTKTR